MLKDRVVLVTGATGGLGPEVARAFAKAGARLVLTARHVERLESVAGSLEVERDRLLAVPSDLADAGSIEAVVRDTLERFGRIDVLAHVAGGFEGGAEVHETAIETFDAMMDLNARAVLRTLRAVVPAMLERRSGSIVVVGAQAALHGGSSIGAYAASKAAAVRLVESLAAEVGGSGIRINAVLPATIDTPGNRRAMPNADRSSWIAPEAVADVIVFLASDAARAVRGAAIPLGGPA